MVIHSQSDVELIAGWKMSKLRGTAREIESGQIFSWHGKLLLAVTLILVFGFSTAALLVSQTNLSLFKTLVACASASMLLPFLAIPFAHKRSHFAQIVPPPKPAGVPIHAKFVKVTASNAAFTNRTKGWFWIENGFANFVGERFDFRVSSAIWHPRFEFQILRGVLRLPKPLTMIEVKVHFWDALNSNTRSTLLAQLKQSSSLESGPEGVILPNLIAEDVSINKLKAVFVSGVCSAALALVMWIARYVTSYKPENPNDIGPIAFFLTFWILISLMALLFPLPAKQQNLMIEHLRDKPLGFDGKRVRPYKP